MIEERPDPETVYGQALDLAERKKAALVQLEHIAEQWSGDPEIAHLEADKVLLRLIDDEQVERAFNAVERWYA